MRATPATAPTPPATRAAGSIEGDFSQSQSSTVSYRFHTDDAYSAGSSSSPGYWYASGGSGSTTASGSGEFSYAGTGEFGLAGFLNGTMGQDGNGNESFSYTKNYVIGSDGAWQFSSASGGASGSGATNSHYTGNVPWAGALPQFAADAVGLEYIPVTGSDQQTGEDHTSYSFQTYATFNGIDWSETGTRTSSGSGSTTNALSASVGGLVFHTLFDPIGTSGSAGLSGTDTTSFEYVKHSFLDDNAAWQNAGGAGSFTAEPLARLVACQRRGLQPERLRQFRHRQQGHQR